MSRSCHACKSKKIRCDKRTPCSSCMRSGNTCDYPPAGPRVRRTKKTIMAEMASRITSLELNLAKATAQKASSSVVQRGTKPTASLAEIDSASPDGLLIHEDASSQYFNETLVSRVISEDENIKAALITSHTEHKIELTSLFDPTGILSSCCLSQHPSMFHPPKAIAIRLWNVYLNNVEICTGSKLTHVPTDEIRLYSTIDNPSNAKLDDLMFCYSIYFAATVSLDESIAPQLLQPGKSTQLLDYKNGLEQSFSHANLLNRPTLTGLRALTIYLSAVRIYNRGKAIWILNGLAIRIAQSLGVHRDGKLLGLPPFDSELRRRLWWHLITRDSRAGEDFGLSSPTVFTSASDVKLPRNINDVDIYPGIAELPPDKPGWTSMTFSLVNIDLAKAGEKLALAASCSPRPSESTRREIIQEARSRIEERLDKCNPITPHQRLTVHCSHFLLQKLEFFTRQQWLFLHQPGSKEMLVTDASLMEALGILESRTMDDDPFLEQFSWAKKIHPQYHVTLYVLWHLCVRPEGQHVDRAWKAIDSIFAQEIMSDSSSNGASKVVVLVALKTRAEAERKKIHLKNGKRKEAGSFEGSAEFQVSGDPLELIEELNFDDMDFGGEAQWSSWTSLLYDFQAD